MSRPTVASEAFRLKCDVIGQVKMAAKLSKKLGRPVHQGSVTGWANAKHLPSIDVVLAIKALFPDIDITLWAKPARKSA